MGYGVAVRQLLQDAIDELKPDPARAFSLQIIRGQSVRFESGQAAGSSILNLLPTDKALAGADPDSTHKMAPSTNLLALSVNQRRQPAEAFSIRLKGNRRYATVASSRGIEQWTAKTLMMPGSGIGHP